MSAPNVDVVNHSPPTLDASHGPTPDAVLGAEAVVTPPARPELNRSQFGILEHFDGKAEHSAGNFKYSEELRKSYQDTARQLVDEIKNYQMTGELSTSQQKLLELYNKDPNALLDTAEGWIITHLAIEKELFLRSALVQKDLQLLVERKGDQPKPETKVTIEDDEIKRGILNKYGKRGLLVAGLTITAPLSLPFLGGAWAGKKMWESATTHSSRKITLELHDQVIDISSLPEADRKYLEYLGNGAPEKTAEFILQAGKSQMDFYKELGVDRSHMEGGLASSRFLSATGVEGTRQKLGTTWESIQTGAVKKIVAEKFGGTFPTTDADRSLLYSLAQQQTIEHFANKALLATVEKGSAPSAETSSSIKVMEDRAKTLSSPAEIQKLKTQKEAELQESQTRDGEVDTEISTQRGKVQEADEKIQKLTVKEPTLRQEITDLKTSLQPFETAINTIRQQISDAETQYPIDKAKAPADKHAQIETDKNQIILAYTKQIDQIVEKMKPIQAEIKTRQDSLNELITLPVDKKIAEDKLAAAEKEKRALKSRITRLKKQIEQPLATTVQEKVEDLETTVESLKRHSDIISGVLRNENGLTPQILSDNTPVPSSHPRFASAFEQGKEVGYLATLDHLFQYSKKADPKKAFDIAQRILPPDILTLLIEEHFDLPPVLSPATATLSDVLLALRTRGTTSSEMSSLFVDIMDNIEERGLRTA